MTGPSWRPRKLPYLHRNWRAAINSLQHMGNKPSLITADHPTPFVEGFAHHESESALEAPPAKRRRFSDPPRHQAADEAASRPEFPGLLLPAEPVCYPRCLRIETLRVLHRDSSRVRSRAIFNASSGASVKDVSSTRSRCKVTVLCQQEDGPVILNCDSQICTIKTFKNPVGPSLMAHIQLTQPFFIPEDKILISRDDDGTFDLADRYTLIIDLEPAGDPNWPPLNLATHVDDAAVFYADQPPPQSWCLSTSVPGIFRRGRSTTRLQLRKKIKETCPTEFDMEVDTRWTTNIPDRLITKRREKGVLDEIVVHDPENGILGYSDDHPNGQLSNGAHDDLEDVAEGELTPSRSLRRRHNTEYNLKKLSDNAQGKAKRRRQKLEKQKGLENSQVTYYLPEESVVIDGLLCCICMAENQTFSQLRAHYLSHSRYRFDYESRPGKGGHYFKVSVNPNEPPSPINSIRPRIFQLGRPTKRFDLDKYLEGDDSWVTSRFGPDHDRLVRGFGRSTTKKAVGHNKKIKVPPSKQPLFDPLSKAQLEPGQDIRSHVADDTWLIQKHRDTLQDFLDVDPHEKEYIKAWDAFIIKKRVSSTAFFPREFLNFVREKGPWLVAKKSRMTELGKHMSVLTVGGSIKDETIQDVMALIKEFQRDSRIRSDESVNEDLSISPRDSPRRSKGGCTICGLRVAEPSLLICTNKKCSKRLYHDECVQGKSIMPPNGLIWRCDSCYKA